MSNPAIRVHNLGKEYQIGAREIGYTTFREAVAQAFFSPFRRFQNLSGRSGKDESFWALKDVSFDVRPGEVVGIIGRNGAGKSTLLKILSQITEPTTGRVEINGRVASLLEVGTGFHPELTGRENVFLNGAILGMSRLEIHRKFDEIVEFSGVEQFLDTPIKRYSSGMQVRLAFAVAAHLEPEILIIDEVLAVGDAEFQTKCLGKMQDVAKTGRTVLFVSHNIPAVRTLCSKSLLLNRGQCVYDGPVNEGIELYTRGFYQSGASWTRPQTDETSKLVFTDIELKLQGHQPELTLIADLILRECVSYTPAFVAIEISDSDGTVVMQAVPVHSGFLTPNGQGHKLQVTCQLPPLIPGVYIVSPWVGPSYTETYDMPESPVSFTVEESPTKQRTFPFSKSHGWIVPQSSVEQTTL